MENTGKQKFEDQWQASFRDAEVKPSDSVWSTIELELERTENKGMRKRVVFYQWVAAAAVLAVMLAVGVGLYINKPDTLLAKQDVVKSESSTSDLSLPEESTGISPRESSVAARRSSEALSAGALGNGTSLNGGNDLKDDDSRTGDSTSERIAYMTETVPFADTMDVANSFEERPVVSSVSIDESATPEATVLAEVPKPDIVERKVAEQEQSQPVIGGVPPDIQEQDEKARERVWASVAMAAGSFQPNPGFGLSAADYSALNDPNGQAAVQSPSSGSSSSAPGTSFAFGFSVGKKLSDRWVAQSGVHYLNQSIGYTSNFRASSGSQQYALVAEYADDANRAYTITSPYSINSVLEFISVPVVAGYLLVDQRTGVQLNAGVATDFFLKNTLTDETGQSESFTQGAGSDSPYRNVNVAGLFSTEVSYRLTDRYRVSVAPGMRYSFGSLFKDQPGNPVVFNVGFGLRYLFE